MYCCWKNKWWPLLEKHYLNMLTFWSAQNRSISSEICLENNHKIGRFLQIAFWWSLPRKLLRNFHEISQFFHKFVPKNSAKFDFFFHDLLEALNREKIVVASCCHGSNIFCISTTMVLQIWQPCWSVHSYISWLMSRNWLIWREDHYTFLLNMLSCLNREFKMSLWQRHREHQKSNRSG